MAALAANATLAVTVRSDNTSFMLALGATFAVIAGLAIFFVWTYPINQATEPTHLTLQWREMRNQWEFSHAASACVMLLALVCSTLSALSGQVRH